MVYSKIVLSSVRAISQGLNVAPITAVMNREVRACVCVLVCLCVCVCAQTGMLLFCAFQTEPGWPGDALTLCRSDHSHHEQGSVCVCLCVCVCVCVRAQTRMLLSYAFQTEPGWPGDGLPHDF